MDDVFEEARSRICKSLIHEMFQCAGSYTDKGEYYILSPLRADRNIGSFSINEDTGLFIDRAKDGDEGDFITLVSRAYGITPLDAAKKICGSQSTYIVTASERADAKKKKDDEAKDWPKPILPIPETESVLEKLKSYISWSGFIELWGQPTKVYRYYNYEGEWKFCVVRYEKEKKENQTKREKNDILFYFGEGEKGNADQSLGKWKAKRHPDLSPFQPYGIERVKTSILPILIVEGEKCKQAAQEALEGRFIVLSWIGGTKNIQKTDWGFLKMVARGRDVYFWPDADSQRDKNSGELFAREIQPGMSAAFYVKSIIPETIILDVYRAFPIETAPAGYDVADYIRDGKNAADFIEEFTPYNNIEFTNLDPYEVYRNFIDHFYDHDNLEQFGGWYWSYNVAKHYWERSEKIDLECNLQRWFEETGLQWIISKKCETTEFINKVKQYIGRHSVGYVKDNPLKDAAVSPFIHFSNGAIEFTKSGSEFYSREKYSDDFFRKRYPISCLDIHVKYDGYKNIDPEKDFPAFYYFVKNMIPRDYMAEHAENAGEVIYDTLMYFAQMICYIISPIKDNEYIFGLYGDERTGKSFFVKIIKELIGRDFCTERRIEDMANNRFASSDLWGSKVYIEPDLKTREALPEAFIKSYNGEIITTVEAKNKDPLRGVKMSLAMIFVSNYEFQVHGTGGINRRLMLVPFKNKIEKHDTRLLDKICGEYPHGDESPGSEGETFDERSGLIALALLGWDLLIKNGFYMKAPEWVNNEKSKWYKEANAVSKFVEEEIKGSSSAFLDFERNELYEKYTAWCKQEGRKELGKKNFLEEVRKENVFTERRAGSSFRFYYSSTAGTVTDDLPF